MAYADLIAQLADAPDGLALDHLDETAVREAQEAGLAETFSSWAIDYVRLTNAGRRAVGLPEIQPGWLERLLSRMVPAR